MDVELNQFQKDLLDSVHEMGAGRAVRVVDVSSQTTHLQDVLQKRKESAPSIEEKDELRLCKKIHSYL